ncbi:uncharacterized protein [Takifugu rubripes]|uniref:uncharacterized protein n=1 Tax=Takifugu rubripes TaxID=31033 RepID=UPI0011457CDD|nr:uncharacterized protein LOC115250339 [Takifugu rubripes]
MSLLANIKKACLSRTPDRGRSPSDSGRSPFDSGRSPFDSERSPFDSGGSPFDSERSLSDSVGSPFEDYKSDKSLQAIDQLVGQDVTMQQDGKETSQPATNRCLHGNNGVAAGNEGHTTSSHPRRVSTPQRNQAATSKHNKEESSQLKPQTGVTESETKRGCLFSEMKDKGKIVNQMKKFTSKLAFPHSRTPTREVTTEPEGEKEPTKTYGVQLLNIPKISKKFQRSRVIKVKYEQ